MLCSETIKLLIHQICILTVSNVKNIKMKRTLIFSVLIVCIGLSVIAQDNNKKDIELIKKTILNAYQDGLQNEGNLDKIDQGFHPTFNMIALNEKGEVWKYPIEEWKKATEKKKSDGNLPRSGDNLVKIEIPLIDVSGVAAIAKLKFFVGQKLTYIDYMSLYKIDGKWKIVAKIYANAE